MDNPFATYISRRRSTSTYSLRDRSRFVVPSSRLTRARIDAAGVTHTANNSPFPLLDASPHYFPIVFLGVARLLYWFVLRRVSGTRVTHITIRKTNYFPAERIERFRRRTRVDNYVKMDGNERLRSFRTLRKCNNTSTTNIPKHLPVVFFTVPHTRLFFVWPRDATGKIGKTCRVTMPTRFTTGTEPVPRPYPTDTFKPKPQKKKIKINAIVKEKKTAQTYKIA